MAFPALLVSGYTGLDLLIYSAFFLLQIVILESLQVIIAVSRKTAVRLLSSCMTKE